MVDTTVTYRVDDEDENTPSICRQTARTIAGVACEWRRQGRVVEACAILDTPRGLDIRFVEITTVVNTAKALVWAGRLAKADWWQTKTSTADDRRVLKAAWAALLPGQKPLTLDDGEENTHE